MKELDSSLISYWRTYWGFLDLPKKIWDLGEPTHYGPRDPQIRHFGVPGHMVGGAPKNPQVPNFFWEVQEDPIGPPVKIK